MVYQAMKNFIKTKLNNEILRDGGILLMASGLGGVFNWFFQFFMGRGLLSYQFATLYALLAITMISSIPAMSIQTLMAKQVSHLRARNEIQKAAGLSLHFLKRVSLASFLLLTLFFILRFKIATFLNIEEINPVIIMGIVVSLAFILPIGYGVLQGLQRFAILGTSLIIFSGTRLILALILVFYFHLGTSGALSSSIFAFIITSFSIFLVLKREFKGHIERTSSVEKIESFMWVLLVSFTFTFILSFIDIILVKHFFIPSEAARYSAASVFGRVVFYLPYAFSGAMFPKVSHAHSKGESTIFLLKSTLFYSFILSLLPAVCFLILPEFFLGLLKQEYLPAANLLRIFGFAMLPFVLFTVFVYYNLAMHNKKIMYVLGASTVFHLFVLNAFHKSLPQVIIALGSSGLIILLFIALVTFRSVRK